MDHPSIDWKKSTRCGPNAQCVEVGLVPGAGASPAPIATLDRLAGFSFLESDLR